MIIGHYEHEIWAKGGIASYIRRLSQAQRAAGHTVYFFSRRSCEAKSDCETPILTPTDADLFQQAKAYQLDVLHLHRSIRSTPPPDLAIVRTLHGHAPYCPSGSRYLGQWEKPCDRPYSLHGCLWGHFIDRCGSLRPHNLQRGFQETWHEMATLPTMPVITVSQFLKDQLIRTGYPEKLIHVLYLAAPDIANSSPPSQVNPPRFLFLGRMIPEKGLQWLLRSLQKVAVPVHLDIAGEGYQEPEIRQLVQHLGIGDRITFHGWVSSEKTLELFQSARAVIFPSIWHEPGGTVAFEAMAHARAVIMSSVGGMPEIVLNEINGLLVEPNDCQSLARSIERLATDLPLARRLGEKGRETVIDQFTLQNHLDQLMQIYEQCLNRKSSLSSSQFAV